MDTIFEDPMFFISIVVGAVILAGISGAYQKYGPETTGDVKPKAILRDGILGAIFTAMAWTFVPESMKGLTSAVASGATSAASTTASTISDYDIQVGPVRF
jgi:hypothetical protein